MLETRRHAHDTHEYILYLINFQKTFSVLFSDFEHILIDLYFDLYFKIVLLRKSRIHYPNHHQEIYRTYSEKILCTVHSISYRFCSDMIWNLKFYAVQIWKDNCATPHYFNFTDSRDKLLDNLKTWNAPLHIWLLANPTNRMT